MYDTWEGRVHWKLTFQTILESGETLEQEVSFESLERVRKKVRRIGSFAKPIKLEKIVAYSFLDDEDAEVGLVL